MRETPKLTDTIMNKIAIPVIAIAGILLLLFLILEGRGQSSENNAYIRVINCIVSYNASTRTKQDIESCYVRVENDLGVMLKRYDAPY